MIEILSKIVKTDVTCVKCYQNFILAGIGGNLLVFTVKGEILQTYNIFYGQKIHGIVPNQTNQIAVFGANLFKIIEFDFIKSRITKVVNSKKCEDWIFAVQWLDLDSQISTFFAKNYISLWTTDNLKVIENVGCKERCTLYSATLVNSTWNSLVALSGTVFGHILIWKPSGSSFYSPVLWRLTGHDGAIFSIAYTAILNQIVSTSDDRTVRIWQPNKYIFTDSTANTDNAEIKLKHTMYGHIARVFRCKIIGNFIVTGGEDSFVHIWDFDGALIRKFETHQNGCIWALDYCELDESIVTGGGDCGVSMYPLALNKKVHVLPTPANEIPRSLKITRNNNVVLVTNNGQVKYYLHSEKKWIDICLHEDLKCYAILETSLNRDVIALAGLHGSIHIYKELHNSLIHFYSLNNNNKSRIYSLHFLTSESFLTSTTEGVMTLWHIHFENKCLDPKQNFILPPCKERWATSAVLCFENKLAVGDRKGNIHIYSLDKEEINQTIKKAQCYLGVTALYYLDNQLVSLGRNAILNKYKLDQSQHLSLVSSDKLPFAWLASIIQQNTNLLIGFSGSKFIIFNLQNRRSILEINCGGGHRSWDLNISTLNVLNFIFIKDKKLHLYTEKSQNILTFDLIQGYHTKEINAGSIIKLKCNNKYVFISGGEDTTIRISVTDIISFNNLFTVKSHLSSVRCIFVHPLDNNEFLIISGGGRAQIVLQKLQILYKNNEFHSLNCQLLDSYYKQLDENEAETRIMDFIIINFDSANLLVAGCSDGTLKCCTITRNYEIKFEHNLIYDLKCILKLGHIKVCNRNIIISMATDGKLVFWDFTNFLTANNLKPFYQLQVHQSGINSFHFKVLSRNTCIFCTGGDDNAIHLNILKFDIIDSEFSVVELTKWRTTQAHGSQITGVFITNCYFITTSIDQHLSVFKYTLLENVLKCDMLTQFCSAVSDIQGMTCVFDNDNEGILTFLYGKGIDICHLKGLK